MESECSLSLFFPVSKQTKSGLDRLTGEAPRTHRNTRLDRTPLDEWSARRRGVYLHDTETQMEDRHALSEIRNRDSSNRVPSEWRLRQNDPRTNKDLQDESKKS